MASDAQKPMAHVAMLIGISNGKSGFQWHVSVDMWTMACVP